MNKKKLILISIAILLIIVIILAIIISGMKSNKQGNDNSLENHVKTAEEKNQEELNELKTLGEKKRMEFYVSKFFSFVEDRDYKSAYNLLYDEFKQNYFPTEDDFEKYVKNKYADLITLSYGTIERLGEYYVLTVNFSDVITNTKNFKQLFVLKENGLNDFVLSFQAE